ncbi:MAG: nuclease [Thaumarchaeota archaeon]|nr:nuclease [Nitrososphaerota archaeon]
MLNTVYREAIKNREKILSVLKGPKFEQIVQRAQQNWVEYTPKKQDSVLCGVDSSFNSTKFQGMELWVVTAVGIQSDGTIVDDLHRQGLGRVGLDIAKMASEMEVDICRKAVDVSDIVMMDGSLYSQFMTRQAGLTPEMFKNLGSQAGDIFYYNHATKTPGFSRVFADPEFGRDKVISSIYARLSDSTPLIKVELFGGNHTDDEIKSVLDRLYKTSVGGYPYALKLAHNNCKISGADLAKLVSLYGISNEIGSREVLE